MKNALFWLGLMLCLLVPNAMMWQKQASLERGRTVYLRLAPADPRSLMQGDYMRLNYAVQPPSGEVYESRGTLRATVDPHGVIVEIDPRKGEVPLRYRLEHGLPRVATDAFFFEEGKARRYEGAAYGKFHLSEDGTLTLRGLTDASLRDL